VAENSYHICVLFQINPIKESTVDGALGDNGVSVLHHVAQAWNLEIDHALTQNQARGENIATVTLLNIDYATS
jgi:hypothetical protein